MRQQASRQRQQAALSSQLSTPEIPQTQRHRQRRHSQRRSHGLPAASPPTQN